MSDSQAAAGPLAARRGAGGRVRAVLVRWAAFCAGLSGWRRLAMAVALGAAGALALPPAGAAPVLLLCVPPLLWLLDGVRSRWGAFAVGWGFAFGFLLFSLYWIAFALTVDLPRFFWMIPFAAAGLPAFLAMFTGLATLGVYLLRLSGVAQALGFAVLWSVTEWLRGHVLTGFPWNLPGYVWVDWLAVLQSVSVIGIYGLTLLTAVLAALPAAVIDRRAKTWSRGGLAAFGLALAVFAALTGMGAWRLAAGESGTVPGVVLRLVQPNIPQAQKWDPAFRHENFLRHRALSVSAGPRPVTHVIWPETAVPYALGRDENARDAIAAVTPPGGLTLTGAPRFAPEGAEPQHWNSLIAIDSRGDIVAIYDKAHLVPFGEYVPFREILPIDTVVASRVDYSAGPGVRTLSLPGLPPVSPLICYEAIFPGAVVAETHDNGEQPSWLLNITNDAWYGETAGPYQHFAIALTRAVEEGLPLVRVASTGISGVVDSHGRVTARLGLGERGVLDADLPAALDRPTAYRRFGDSGFWLLTGSFTVIVLGLASRQPKVLA
ncbi:MAG: apolipoprotein N-acyltransferase [Alphaproteobacteria bacterium]|nr:apolipoprotein N-acyltransferase [Alphaproteobacteria bacterium]